MDRAVVATSLPHRRELVVSAARVERWWSVDGRQQGQGQGQSSIVGRTTDLAEVARVAQAWQDGVALDDIARVAPFVRLTGRLEVPDLDPGRLVASQWARLRAEARQPIGGADQPGYRALVEAAYAEPRLRQLYPFTSHWSLHWSTCVRVPFDCPLPSVEESSGGYAVVTAGGVLVEQTATAQQAVALVLAWLPPDAGPAVLGPGQRRQVHDPLRAEAERRLAPEHAGTCPWFRIGGTTVVQWQAVFDRYSGDRQRWRYAAGGLEQDRPTAAQAFARPLGVPPATLRRAWSAGAADGDHHALTFHLTTPDEICFTLDLAAVDEQDRMAVLLDRLDDLAASFWPTWPSSWVLMAPQDDPTRPVLALRGLAYARIRLL